MASITFSMVPAYRPGVYADTAPIRDTMGLLVIDPNSLRQVAPQGPIFFKLDSLQIQPGQTSNSGTFVGTINDNMTDSRIRDMTYLTPESDYIRDNDEFWVGIQQGGEVPSDPSGLQNTWTAAGGGRLWIMGGYITGRSYTYEADTRITAVIEGTDYTAEWRTAPFGTPDLPRDYSEDPTDIITIAATLLADVNLLQLLGYRYTPHPAYYPGPDDLSGVLWKKNFQEEDAFTIMQNICEEGHYDWTIIPDPNGATPAERRRVMLYPRNSALSPDSGMRIAYELNIREAPTIQLGNTEDLVTNILIDGSKEQTTPPNTSLWSVPTLWPDRDIASRRYSVFSFPPPSNPALTGLSTANQEPDPTITTSGLIVGFDKWSDYTQVIDPDGMPGLNFRRAGVVGQYPLGTVANRTFRNFLSFWTDYTGRPLSTQMQLNLRDWRRLQFKFRHATRRVEESNGYYASGVGGNPNLPSGIVIGLSNPGNVYVSNSLGGWDLIGTLDFCVFALCYWNGRLYAASNAGSGTGGNSYVYRYEGISTWTKIGTFTTGATYWIGEFKDGLYTVSGAYIYRYDTDNNWTRFSCPWLAQAAYAWTSPLNGIELIQLGYYGYDELAKFDGISAVLTADFGGSCIFDYAVYNNSLYCSAWVGHMYVSTTGLTWGWGGETGYSSDILNLVNFKGNLYIGDEGGRIFRHPNVLLYTYGGPISQMEADDNYLYFAVGGRPNIYGSPSYGSTDVKLYRWDGINAPEIVGSGFSFSSGSYAGIQSILLPLGGVVIGGGTPGELNPQAVQTVSSQDQISTYKVRIHTNTDNRFDVADWDRRSFVYEFGVGTQESAELGLDTVNTQGWHDINLLLPEIDSLGNVLNWNGWSPEYPLSDLSPPISADPLAIDFVSLEVYCGEVSIDYNLHGRNWLVPCNVTDFPGNVIPLLQDIPVGSYYIKVANPERFFYRGEARPIVAGVTERETLLYNPKPHVFIGNYNMENGEWVDIDGINGDDYPNGCNVRLTHPTTVDHIISLVPDVMHYLWIPAEHSISISQFHFEKSMTNIDLTSSLPANLRTPTRYKITSYTGDKTIDEIISSATQEASETGISIQKVIATVDGDPRLLMGYLVQPQLDPTRQTIFHNISMLIDSVEFIVDQADFYCNLTLGTISSRARGYDPIRQQAAMINKTRTLEAGSKSGPSGTLMRIE